MATRAPTGTVTSPPASRASSHGFPSLATWAKVAAPTATKAAWATDTCPDVRTSSCREAKITTKITASVQNCSFVPTKAGAARNTPATTA